MLFSYTAKLKNGEVGEGLLEAKDRFVAARELRSRGSIPISISQKSVRTTDLSFLFVGLVNRVKMADLIIFTKNLSGMLRAGLSVSRALSVLQKQNKKPFFGKVMTSLESDINAGGTLSLGLAKFPSVFSPIFVSMIRSGEESGNLPGSLSEIGINLEKANNITKKVKGAFIYPGVILSAMVLVGILMFAFVVPTLSATFKEIGVDMPFTTRMIVWFGDFFSNNLILTFVGLIVLVFGAFLIARSKFISPYLDFLALNLPVISKITRELNTARTARTMSSLLSSGVSITRATEIAMDVVQNSYYKKVLEETRIMVEKGAPFFKVFASHADLYPIMMSEMVEVGEETGKLKEMLLDVADFYETEIENKTKNLSTIIEPVLMVLIGAGVGFFAISMISPLYSVMDTIK